MKWTRADQDGCCIITLSTSYTWRTWDLSAIFKLFLMNWIKKSVSNFSVCVCIEWALWPQWVIYFCDIPLRRLASVTSAAHRLRDGFHSCSQEQTEITQKEAHNNLSCFYPFTLITYWKWTISEHKRIKWVNIWGKKDFFRTTSPPGGQSDQKALLCWGSFIYGIKMKTFMSHSSILI